MSLIQCPECGKQISNAAKNCPSCGYPIARKQKLSKEKVEITFNIKFNKRIVVIVSSICILIISLLIVINFAFGSLHKAKSYYAKGDIESFKSITLSQKDKNKFGEYLQTETNQLYEQYRAEKIEHDQVLNELDKINKFSNSSMTQSVRTKIDKLFNSKKAYQAGMDFIEKDDYIEAYENLLLVEEDDVNYQSAINEIDKHKNNLVEAYKAKAKAQANIGLYEEAITYVDKGLELAPDDSDLLSLKSSYNDKAEEKRKKKELRDKTISIGTSFNTNHFSIDVKNIELTREVYPASRGYLYYECSDDSSIWLAIKFKIKNRSAESVKLEKVVSKITVTYNSQNTYNSKSLFYTNSSSIDQVYSWDKLDASFETYFYVCVPLPLEAKSNNYPIIAELTIDGDEKYINYR